MTRRVVVSKVELIAHLIVLDDDGQVVNEAATKPTVVIGRDWPDYSGEPFRQAIAPLVAELEAGEV